MGVRPANDKMGRRRTCGDWCKDSFKSLGLGREILVVLWCLSAGPPSARVCHGDARADAIRDENRTETVGGGEYLRAWSVPGGDVLEVFLKAGAPCDESECAIMQPCA
jgi:hypothetical protein